MINQVKKARKDIYQSGKLITKKGGSYFWIKENFKDKMRFKNMPTPYQIYCYVHKKVSKREYDLICLKEEIVGKIWDCKNVVKLNHIRNLLM
jgi:hypothetical protein